MAYMVRMLPVGFVNTYDMIKTLQTAGLGSLELFCMGLKAMGSYLARTLSYHGANFVMDDVQLSPQFRCDMELCFAMHVCLLPALRLSVSVTNDHRQLAGHRRLGVSCSTLFPCL
jgi:hypothetical protein